ncbi:hypothetical protein Tco_0842052 [Tanacetum coccineum]|uniref:CCHC-type domain-containing protein n=1 Tax=Tanacetum coccineum TaxID=301880 RepID=A0ABQ5AY70_9ASTR
MSTQQDIYAVGSENCPLMLNKENYVPWSSRLLHYAKSRPNGKLIYNSIINGPYTILLGLPEDIYAAVDSCESAQEIWLRVQQMMKGSDIGIQKKKAKLFNEWERFTSTDGESIESYYHRFSKLMNDFKRNKHFPEKIASNLKLLNNLQPEWSRHVTIVHQTKDLHTTDYTQLYDFMKYNQKEVDDLRAERLALTHDPLALMANSNNPFNYPMQITQPGMNMGQDRQMQMVGGNRGNQFRQYDGQMNPNGNGNVVVAWAEGNAIGNNGNQIRCYNCRGLGYLAGNCTEEAGIQIQAEEFDLMAAAADRDEIEEVNANCILMANLQQALTSEEQYTELLEPIPEPHQVQQNDRNVIFKVTSVEQEGGIVYQHPATVEETRAYFESLYNNLAIEVEKVNLVNRKMKETNADLTTELARYKNQEKCFEISQEKYDKLERCYKKYVYQEQCLTKKINALHLSSGKQITPLNEEISNLNKQLSKENSTVSSLLEEKKKSKSDFKIREDEFLDKQIQLENKIIF